MAWIPQDLFDRIVKVMPIAGVEAAIERDDGRFLVLRRKLSPLAGEWCLPGGRITKGETLEGALRREVLEETGLAIISFKLLNVYSILMPERHDIGITFLCRCEGSVELNDENSTWVWLSPQEMLKSTPHLQEVARDLTR